MPRQSSSVPSSSGQAGDPFLNAGISPSPANSPDSDLPIANLMQASFRGQQRDYQKLAWQGSFHDYLDRVQENPLIARNAHQRIYDMITAEGSTERVEHHTRLTHYNFFDDPRHGGKDAVFGIDRSLMDVVKFFESAAEGYGTDKRILLLHGPVGSAKSTVARLIKQGLEEYSRTDAGAMYTFGFRDEPNGPIEWSPMHEEPLNLLPTGVRQSVIDQLNQQNPDERPLIVKGGMNPWSRFKMQEYLERYDGDLEKALEHVVVKRLVLSEQERRGVGTFQPKDEKNQDSTELTGDINYRKIATYGADSDPRAFNFDGEFIVANRGIFECVEMLKLQKEFLYDFLTASQEGRIKPKKFSQIDIDVCILGHTNEPEYRRLIDDKLMEAIVDRMVRIDIPYNTRISDELKIYERDFEKAKARTHFAPHTLEMAALFSVLSRLEPPSNDKIALSTKAKLYNGQQIPGFNEQSIVELRQATKREGLDGIGPRFVQDTISAVLVASNREDGINPFMVLNAIEDRIKKHPLCKTDKDKQKFAGILGQVRQEYVDTIKTEVQRAIAADEGAIARLCGNYIDNIRAFTQKEKVKNPITNLLEEPNEPLMRSIEEKLEPPVSEVQKRDFRAEIMNYIAALSLDGKRFDYQKSPRLQKALETKLFEDQKDSIRLSQITSSTVDRETQEKIDIVRTRLIKNFGYNERSATDVLEYVGSIFARGKGA